MAAATFFDKITQPNSSRQAIRVDNQFFGLRATSLLYLEPVATLAEIGAAESDHQLNGIRSMAQYIRREAPATVPIIIDDLAIFYGIGRSSPNDLTAARIRPITAAKEKGSSGNVITLPCSVMAVIRLQIMAAISNHQGRQLRDHSFVRRKLGEYLDGIRSTGIIGNYQNHFVKDQSSSSLLIAEAQYNLNEVNKNLSSNSILSKWRKGDYVVVKFFKDDYEGYISIAMGSMIEHVDQATETTKAHIKILQEHGRHLSESLRDAVNIEIAKININIQPTLKRLTYTAVMLGLLALIVGILPDFKREQIFKFFMNIPTYIDRSEPLKLIEWADS